MKVETKNWHLFCYNCQEPMSVRIEIQPIWLDKIKDVWINDYYECEKCGTKIYIEYIHDDED